MRVCQIEVSLVIFVNPRQTRVPENRVSTEVLPRSDLPVGVSVVSCPTVGTIPWACGPGFCK